MPIRITNEAGVGHETRILNAETGEDICRVVPVNYSARLVFDQIVTLECEVGMVKVDVVPGVVRWHVPMIDGDVAEIRMKDGRVIHFGDDGVPDVSQVVEVTTLDGTTRKFMGKA